MEDRPEYRIEERPKTPEECFREMKMIVDALVPELKFEFVCVVDGNEVYEAKTQNYSVTIQLRHGDLGKGYEVAIHTGSGNFQHNWAPRWTLSQRYVSREAAEKCSRDMIADLFMALAGSKPTLGKG